MTQPSPLSKDDYDTFRSFLEEACGIVLGDNKHYLVTSRLNRLIGEFSFPSLGRMLDELQKNNNVALKERIIDAMTTNETMWFRDTYPFDILKESIFPEFAKKSINPLRIWSAASSTGQESYSISMTLHEFQLANPGLFKGRLEILGTDISPSVIRSAQQARYDELSIVRGLSDERRDRFFNKAENLWEVKPEIRGCVRFTELNLLQNYTLMGKFDIIFCRNVLIYFSSELKTDILTRMAQALNPGGYLFLGGSESPTGYCNAFEMRRLPQGVIYQLKMDWRP